MRPLLSIIVPTIGRATLARTLASVRDQAGARDVELLVVGDSFGSDGPPAWERESLMVDVLSARARYVRHDGGLHAWGHPQRNFGQSIACGRYLAWLQDDDIYTPGGVGAMLRAIESDHEPAVHLFRVRTWQAGVVWGQRGVLGFGQIDADCIVAPNDPARLAQWPPHYNGDWDFIRDTVALWGGAEQAAWHEDIIAIGRP